MSICTVLWLAGVLVLAPACADAGLTAVPAAPLPKPADKRLDALIASHRGHPVVINFWATWCEPCREEMPALQRLADRGRDRGLGVVTVAVADSPRRVEDFLRESALHLPVVDDREQTISRAWGAWAIPTTVVLDRRHRARLRGVGPIDWDSPAVADKLQSLFK